MTKMYSIFVTSNFYYYINTFLLCHYFLSFFLLFLAHFSIFCYYIAVVNKHDLYLLFADVAELAEVIRRHKSELQRQYV